MDCSWNRLRDRAGLPPGLPRPPRPSLPRRLPFLLAANPQHFGRLGELNTAEALGAALYLAVGAPAAERFFSRWTGGSELLRLNAERLSAYSSVREASEIAELERRFFP